VFRALHTTLNITVAVKFLLHPSGGAAWLSRDSQGGASEEDLFLERFRREARLLAQLNHRNVVRVLDFEDQPPLPYVVMEFADGLSLAELIQQMGRIQLNRALDLVVQLIDGLEAARRLGIVHRDVKPANVLVSRDGTAKLVDFGLALQMNRSVSASPAGAGPRPAVAVEGTVAYMAPEQAQNSLEVDHRADIYALGVAFFQMVTGCLPFQARTRNELLMKQLEEPPPLAHVLVPELSSDVSDVIVWMLAKNPADRFQKYDVLKRALLALRSDKSAEVGRLSTAK
jgi:serine/threonine protein kinase